MKSSCPYLYYYGIVNKHTSKQPTITHKEAMSIIKKLIKSIKTIEDSPEGIRSTNKAI